MPTPRPTRCAASALFALAVLLALAASPALAVVTSVEGRSYGVTPPSVQLLEEEEPSTFTDEAETFADEGGHSVVSQANVYAIYWDPYDQYHGDWQGEIDSFLQGMASSSGELGAVFSVDGQYTDRAGAHAGYDTVFAGAYTDTDPYPTNSNCADPAPLEGGFAIACVTDAQIQAELKGFIAQHSLPTGMKSIFYVLTPPGVTVCLDSGGSSGRCSDFSWTSRPAKSTTATAVDMCRNSLRKNDVGLCAKESPEPADGVEETPEAKSYEESFCSYHSAISPTDPTEGDSKTILYAAIPWTAGGLGDGHLYFQRADPATEGNGYANEAPAYYCEDGGFNPASTPIEQQESNPVEQEPSQIGRGPDGTYDHGLADLIENQIAVEQQDIVTDPLLDGWHSRTGGDEVVDVCRNWFALTQGGSVAPAESGLELADAGTLFNQTLGGSIYYLNTAFDRAALQLTYPGISCVPGVRLEPKFTAPSGVHSGEPVSFDGMESTITLDAGTAFSATGQEKAAYASYTWNFGDGTAPVTGYAPGGTDSNTSATPCEGFWEGPCAASVYHTYQYGGTYEVTLTVTDTGGNVATVTEPIVVLGPPAPSSGSGSSSGASGSGSPATASGGSSSSSAAGGAGGGQSAVPAPVLSDKVESTSLKQVKSGGLAVRYTVNEQVAGSVEVLLESAVAKRLGIHGPAATGLAKGFPPSIVIGSAVLVTTKAGHGTIHVKFSSKTAARLARSHGLALTLRLFARNASRQSPQTTTVLDTVVFGR